MSENKIIKQETKNSIINIIAKLDNGSHPSSQLAGTDEALTKLFDNALDRAVEEAVRKERERIMKKLDEEKPLTVLMPALYAKIIKIIMGDPTGDVCPQCHDRGKIYDDNGGYTVCPCHLE